MRPLYVYTANELLRSYFPLVSVVLWFFLVRIMEVESTSACRLCNKLAVLRQSHIIPHAHLKKVKGGSNQLIWFSQDINTKPIRSNTDPKEKLLCESCEHFLNSNYETYGISVFRNSKNVRKQKNFIVINNFNYKKFYLYLISILWRASISSLDDFNSVRLGDDLNELLRAVILNGTLKINTSIRVDHFLRVCVLRVIDSSGTNSDESIRRMLINFNCDHSSDGKVVIFYFMVEGFLISYFFTTGDNIHDLRAGRQKSQIRNLNHAKIYKVEAGRLVEIRNIIERAVEHREKYNNEF